MVDSLRGAKDWGMSPLRFLGQASTGWWEEDSLLASALTRYEATRIGAFGYPKRLTEGDTEGWFEVQLRQDNAQLAFDQWRRDQKGDPPPGMVPTVVYTGPTGA